MKTDLAKVQTEINTYKKDIINFAKDVIRIPSLSCKEKDLVLRIAYEMKKVGFDKVKIDKMGNVIGQIGSGKTKIMIDAHIDTVDVGDITQWSTNPFTPVVKNGVIYGRGATDQKLAIVSMVYAGKLIKKLKLTGDYTVWMVGSCQEEDCDGLPLLHIITKEKIKPDYVIITEPTNLNVHRGHRGRIELKITLKGKSSHASSPERGDNAVYKMSYLIQEIAELNKHLKYDKFLGKGTIAVTYIECKTPSLNAIPDETTIYLDRRLTAGETKQTVINELKSLPSVKKFKAKIEILQYNAISWKGLKVQQEKYFPTWSLPENHLLVQTAIKTATLILGKRPKVDKWTFSTNGVATAGRLGIPTVGFGPGNEIYAHTTKEQMPIEHLLKATMFYALFPVMLTESST